MIIDAHMYVKPEEVDRALPIFERLVRNSRKEEGCVSYDLCRDMRDPAHFVILEHWASPEAADAHGKGQKFTETIAELVPLLAKEGTLTPLERVDID